MTEMAEVDVSVMGNNASIAIGGRVRAIPIADAYTNPLLYGGACRLLGWSLNKGAAGTGGLLLFHDGTGPDGQIIVAVNSSEAPNENAWFGPQGVPFQTSLFVDVGATLANVGSVFIAV